MMKVPSKFRAPLFQAIFALGILLVQHTALLAARDPLPASSA